MKIAVVLFTTEKENPGLNLLRETLEYHKWPDPVVLVEERGFRGHPHKLNTVYNHLGVLRKGGCTHALYTDCWDVICCGSIDPVVQFASSQDSPKLLLSGDAGFWRDGVMTEADFEAIPENVYRWRFINGGGWVGDIDFLIEYFADCHKEKVNDQWFLSRKYLADRKDVAIDNQCRIFQCLSRTPRDIFVSENGAVFNRETATYPPLIHGAGGVPMDWVPTVRTKWAPLIRNY